MVLIKEYKDDREILPPPLNVLLLPLDALRAVRFCCFKLLLRADTEGTHGPRILREFKIRLYSETAISYVYEQQRRMREAHKAKEEEMQEATLHASIQRTTETQASMLYTLS